jgi:hypothetical protein
MGLVPIVHKTEYTRAEAEAVHMRMFGHTRSLPIRFFRDGKLQLQNILVKLPAAALTEEIGTGRGLMFVSHYDSWMNSPGAGDAMLGVCTMLEVMRAQVNNKTLINNIYFLFTDGEEFGALGALAFVQASDAPFMLPELMDKVDMAINLDARGNRGGMILFETSPKAYSVVKLFKKLATRPIGFSVAQLIYGKMDVRTDFTAFLEHGYRGINLVILEGARYYHSPLDIFENLNRSTAWQYLSTSLALADYAANNSLAELQGLSRQAIFFPFLPGNLVLLNFTLAYLLCTAACFLALAFILYQYKEKQLKASFTTILIPALILLSIVSTIFFHPGSYMFWLPLFAISTSVFLKRWFIAYTIAKILAGVTVLLLWVPLVYLVLEIIIHS